MAKLNCLVPKRQDPHGPRRSIPRSPRQIILIISTVTLSPQVLLCLSEKWGYYQHLPLGRVMRINWYDTCTWLAHSKRWTSLPTFLVSFSGTLSYALHILHNSSYCTVFIFWNAILSHASILLHILFPFPGTLLFPSSLLPTFFSQKHPGASVQTIHFFRCLPLLTTSQVGKNKNSVLNLFLE